MRQGREVHADCAETNAASRRNVWREQHARSSASMRIPRPETQASIWLDRAEVDGEEMDGVLIPTLFQFQRTAMLSG